jgi:hypothetical protein
MVLQKRNYFLYYSPDFPELMPGNGLASAGVGVRMAVETSGGP